MTTTPVRRQISAVMAVVLLCLMTMAAAIVLAPRAEAGCSQMPAVPACTFTPPPRPEPPRADPPPSGSSTGGGGGGSSTGGGGGSSTSDDTPEEEKEPPKPPCWVVAEGTKWGWDEVECRKIQYGDWSNERQCYILKADPQPPAGADVWEGRTTGAIYYCTTFNWGWPRSAAFWSENPPPTNSFLGDLPTTLVPDRVRIGITPGYMRSKEARENDQIGVVGAPVWMWIPKDNPKTAYGRYQVKLPSSTGVMTVTLTAGEVQWYMGENGSARPDVVCKGRGTPYRIEFGLKESPDCGYIYRKPGLYRVRAFVVWTVETDGGWGTPPERYEGLLRASSAVIKVGEAQVPIVEDTP